MLIKMPLFQKNLHCPKKFLVASLEAYTKPLKANENLLCLNFEEFLLPLVSSYYHGIYTNLTLQSLTKNVRQTLVFK